MAADRFDIEVRDLVAKSIRSELKAIGLEARSTHALVQQMNMELATGTRAAAASAQTASASAAQAAGRSAQATAASSAAEARAATARTAASTKTKAALETEAQKHERLAQVVERAAQRQQAAANQTAAAFAKAASAGPVLAGSKAQNAASTAFMMNMGGGGGGGPKDPIVSPRTASDLLAVELATTKAAKGIQSVGQMSNNARIAMLDMTHVGINMGQMLATGVNPMRALVMESGRLATAVQYSGGSIKGLLSSTASWIGITKRVSDATKDAAAAEAAAAAMRIATVGSQIASNIAAAETEIALAKAEQEVAVTAAERVAASQRLTAANAELAASNVEAAVTARALATANQAAATAAEEAAAAETVALGGLGLVLGVVAAALTTFVALTGSLEHQANQGATGLKHYSKEMGYTAAEVKKLNAVTVTFGDTAKAIFQVGLERIASAFGISTDQMASKWHSFLDYLATATRATLAGLYAGFMTLSKLANPATAALTMQRGVVEDLKDNYKDAQTFFDDVIKKARSNAVTRQDGMAKDMFNAPHQKKPKAEWDRAKEWAEANAELDVQIGMLDKYGTALERAQRIEQIGRTFREHGKPLTAAETQQLDDKIKKIQEGTRVQEAMTAAEEAANGPERQYSAKVEALNKLFAAGAITAESYTDQLNVATRAYDDAVDPLSALNRELQRNGELMGKYGRSKDVAAYIQQLQQAAEAKGGSIYKRRVGPQGANDNITVTGHGGLNDEAQGMVDTFKKQQRSGEITSRFEEIDPREQKRQSSTNDFILDNYKEMYKAIDEFRQQDVANEEEATERKKNLDTALGTARLEAASKVFGMLAGLQTSHNRTVAAIGKAAAITQATIDGITAVQAALKGPPGPPWSYAIAAATAVMTAANVAKIAGIGFQRGGYTGDGNPNDAAGPVHRQEFVFDAAATRRIGVPALEAMRSGARLNSPTSSNDNRSRANIRVVQGPGTYTEVKERSDGEIEVIAERAARRVAPSAVAADMRDPNSRTSKAMTTHFGARRNRS
jgi:hypothetical protein